MQRRIHVRNIDIVNVLLLLIYDYISIDIEALSIQTFYQDSKKIDNLQELHKFRLDFCAQKCLFIGIEKIIVYCTR